MPRNVYRFLGPLALLLTAVSADAAPPPGCSTWQANCRCETCQSCRDGDPCRHHSAFIREMRCTCRDYVDPLGTKLYSMMGRQITNGTSARLVLYHYDFLPGDSRLNYRGLRQLKKIVGMMSRSTSPLIIQATPGKPELDELRRKLVVAQSSQLSLPLPLERVIVGPSPTHGLDGIDAVINHDRLLQLMQSGGAAYGGGGGGAGIGTSGTGAATAPSGGSPSSGGAGSGGTGGQR